MSRIFYFFIFTYIFLTTPPLKAQEETLSTLTILHQERTVTKIDPKSGTVLTSSMVTPASGRIQTLFFHPPSKSLLSFLGNGALVQIDPHTLQSTPLFQATLKIAPGSTFAAQLDPKNQNFVHIITDNNRYIQLDLLHKTVFEMSRLDYRQKSGLKFGTPLIQSFTIDSQQNLYTIDPLTLSFGIKKPKENIKILSEFNQATNRVALSDIHDGFAYLTIGYDLYELNPLDPKLPPSMRLSVSGKPRSITRTP